MNVDDNRSNDFSVSIVVPAYNEGDCLATLVSQLREVLGGLTKNFEVIIVDDGSSDQTFDRVTEPCRQDARVKGISLSRNVGHQAALACGLEAARGDVVVTVDADLQHPPNFIPHMIHAWQQGFDVVNTVRLRQRSSNALDEKFSKIFYWLFNKVSDVKLIPDSPDFRLLDRRCVDALVSMPEHLKFFRGMVPYIGFNQTTLEFDCPPRFAGERSYTLRKSMTLAYHGLLSFSDAGLKVPLVAGLLILAVTVVYVIASLVLFARGNSELAKGWASLVSLALLSLGLQLVFTGMFGLYLGKIFLEVKRRPIYFVKRTVGMGRGHAETGPGQSS